MNQVIIRVDHGYSTIHAFGSAGVIGGGISQIGVYVITSNTTASRTCIFIYIHTPFHRYRT